MAYDEDLADRIRDSIPHHDGVTERKMFGGHAFLLNGNMAVAASGQGGMLVRCDPALTEVFVREPYAQRMEMRGRSMDGWLRVDAGGVADESSLRRWVRIGVEYAASLPPK
jgi:TfoX/Sxy family transcriptional regulator of competence genes